MKGLGLGPLRTREKRREREVKRAGQGSYIDESQNIWGPRNETLDWQENVHKLYTAVRRYLWTSLLLPLVINSQLECLHTTVENKGVIIIMC